VKDDHIHIFIKYERLFLRSWFVAFVIPVILSFPLKAAILDNDLQSICTHWSFANDFRVSPNQENPSRDSCGNPGVWHYLEGDPNVYPSRIPSSYRYLPKFRTDLLLISGLQAWESDTGIDPSISGLPWVGKNTTGSTQNYDGITWPPKVMAVHPAGPPTQSKHAIIGWRSPVTGRVSISGCVSDLDVGNPSTGILWYIDHYNGITNTNLASGSVHGGGTQSFSGGTGGNTLEDIEVETGDFLYFVVDPESSVLDDTTGLEIVIDTPFLDLPVVYTSFEQASLGYTGSNSSGRVTAWFDHTDPGWGNEDGNLTKWIGPYLGNLPVGRHTCIITGGSCYDSHDGIDFRHAEDGDEPILASAPGTVIEAEDDCQDDNTCSGFGNWVMIDHHNCYATLYAHLDRLEPGIVVSAPVSSRQQIGIMGNTGLSIGDGDGIHLHFGVYKDPNCDGDWSVKYPVDPYGWSSTIADPWPANTTQPLWMYPLGSQVSMGSGGGLISSPSGTYTANVPPGALTDTVTMELLVGPPVAEPSAQLRSTGHSFWLQVFEWLPSGQTANVAHSAVALSGFAEPITMTINYADTEMIHLDEQQMSIFYWDESQSKWLQLPTSVDTGENLAEALTTETGSFSLQASLICTEDSSEPDDNYDAASMISPDGALAIRLFDVAQDEDWFKLATVSGKKYVIQTSSLAVGVDTVIEVYDLDGVTLLASDDNSGEGVASRLEWQALLDGTYFIRVVQASGSTYGCNATYGLNVTQVYQRYLPLVLRKQ